YTISINMLKLLKDKIEKSKVTMRKLSYLKILAVFILSILIIPLLTSCDQTLIDIYTQINPDYSGTRTIDIAVKTEYLQKSEIIQGKDQSLYERIFEELPEGEKKSFDEDEYTHFTSTIEFEDINFLQHISIDNFSETPPERFYAKLEKADYFFYSEYFFEDYIDMKIDDILLSSSDTNSDYNRLNDLLKADINIFNITYQIKFPVKITKHNADLIGDNNIAIWNIKYGEERNIYIEGKKTKFLTYFLIVILGITVLFILFIIIIIIFNSRRDRRRRSRSGSKPLYSYDNYFKRDRYFSNDD
ncbi:MAG: hypothetical protein PHN81_03570, partial [Actinomycetota bacterium]|nr:hypothetical protein [Actinomycetota bacterium]